MAVAITAFIPIFISYLVILAANFNINILKLVFYTFH